MVLLYFLEQLNGLKIFNFMESIKHKLKSQFRELYPSSNMSDRMETYMVLQHFGSYCAQNFGNDKSKSILKLINDVYQQKSLFENNAIENEFFYAIASQLGNNDLMVHLNSIPESLWSTYIKVLVQTQINK